MKKNVLINYIGSKGAGPIYSYEMAKALIEHECNVYAIVSDKMDNIDDWKLLNFKQLVILKSYSNIISFMIVFLRIFFIGKEVKKINAKCIDFIYVPMIHPFTFIINRYFKEAKKIVTLHDPVPHKGSNMVLNILTNKVCEKANKLILLSERFRGFSKQKFNKLDSDISIIPHAVFNYEKHFNYENFKDIYPKDTINFLFFGRITDYKGLNLLGKAYSLLEKKHYNITLTVVGNGNFSKYKSQFQSLKNFKLINRWIKNDEVANFFKGNNVITVLPYTEGTQSGVIPTAMFLKSLIIISDVGGIKEQIKHNETGFLIRSNSVGSLYDKMEYVIKNLEKTEEIVLNARKYITTQTWDNSAELLLKIMKK